MLGRGLSRERGADKIRLLDVDSIHFVCVSSLFAQAPKTEGEGEGEAAAKPAATEEPKPEGEPFFL